MWWENCFYCPCASRTEYNKVAWGGQTSTTSYNILQNKRNVVSYNICLVKKFASDQTSYNKIQRDTTRYNKVAKRVQHFIQHQSCMMLYEMLYSFGRGLSEIPCFIVKFLRDKRKYRGRRAKILADIDYFCSSFQGRM